MRKLLLAIAAVLVVSPGYAQDTYINTTDLSVPSVIGSQWVQSDSNGQVTGRVMLHGMEADQPAGEVLLVSGDTRYLAKVSSDGSFAFDGVVPGVYGLSYQSAAGFAALALQVVEPNSDSPLPTQFAIPATRLEPARAISTITRYLPPRRSSEKAAEAVSKPSEFAPAPTSSLRVARTEDKGVRGRLISAGASEQGMKPAGRMNVLVIRDGVVVGRAVTDFDGTFEIQNLELGGYDLLASGASGFAAIGFELVEPSGEASAALTNTSGEQFVSALQDGVMGEILVQTSPSQLPEPMSLDNPSDDEGGALPLEQTPAPGSGASYAGGGFGGGGGGGGGLGGGGMGIAAMGGVLAAILASDDDDNPIPPAVSVAVP